MALTTAAVAPAAEVQPFTVAVTLYVPEAAVVAPEMVGLWRLDTNPLGPVHEYVAPETAGVVRFRVCPEQIGPLLLAVGAAGMGLTTTVVGAGSEVHPLTVAVTLYVPAAARVVVGIVGFWVEEVKPFGPVQE